MQEAGVPITYAYIADAHDNHSAAGGTFGPGEAGYVAQLKAYDTAFGKFFTELAAHGINKSNTLFVITADENDHFVGGPPSPANCNGVTVPCTYSQVGEIDANMAGLMGAKGITTPFKIHDDSSPTVYLNGQPARDAATTRAFEQAAGGLTAVNPYTGKTDQLTNYLADPVEQGLLHMVTGDPQRTPTFVLFGNPNYYFCAGESFCPNGPSFVGFDTTDAWNHGTVAPEINTTWLGLVGPGVRKLGVDSTTWSDETDIRPTMMTLLGLTDDYTHEGRTLFEVLDDNVLPSSLRAHRATLLRLAQVFKQINAPVGQLGLASLRVSTAAIESSASGDSTYAQLESQLQSITSQRNTLAGQMLAMLAGATFNGQAIDEQQAKSLIDRGQALLSQVAALAGPAPSAFAVSLKGQFTVSFSSAQPGQGMVYFGSGPGCSGLVEVATEDAGSGTTNHTVVVQGNDLPGTVGNNGIVPGTTYWYETVTATSGGETIDNNNGQCYEVTVPGP
jgi:hypothetical protein